jgi:flagellar hook-associated protein 2
MTVSLTGMASGLDTDSIIQQIMAVDQQKISQVSYQQSGVTQHQTLLKAIQSKLDALKSAASALSDTTTTWKAAQSVASSDSAKVDVALTAGAGIGGHTIQVDKLASSAQHGFTYTPSASAGQLTLYYGSDPNATTASKVTIDVAANATASDVATSINANEQSPVYAAVINVNGTDKLVLSARKTGQSSDFSVDTSALGAGQMAEDATYARTGATLNAQYKLDDDTTDRTSESNTITDALPGETLTLKGVTSSPVSITTNAASIDTTAVTKAVQSFVDAYNAVVTTVRADLTDKPNVPKKSQSDYTKGTLFSDSGLDSMLSQLKNVMTQTVSGLGLSSLADIGITVPKSTGTTPTQDATDGKLSFDSSVLQKALTSDYTKVRSLFTGQGTTKGFGSLVGGFVDSQDGTNGILTGRIASDDSSLKDYTSQISNMQDRMNDEQTRLKAQFAAMEAALAQSQTQQAWLTSQIASLPSYSA